MGWTLRRAWARAGWRRLAALAALAALAGCVRAPVQQAGRSEFPRAHAAAVAHLLADFSTHPHASNPWLVEEERGNYTEWSYRVSFECGPRCAGVARVSAAAAGGGGAPSHGRAPRHSVRLELVACSHLPLLPWLKICDEAEVEWRVYGGAAGAEAGCAVEERARAWCGALRVLSGACGRELRDQRRRHLDQLRAALDVSR